MSLTKFQKTALFSLSLLIVSLGQPVWGAFFAFLTYLLGFALFFRFLISFNHSVSRFWWATVWFTGVQLVQFSWFLSHPYLYIIAVHFLVSLIFGLQFGLIGYLADPKKIASFNRIILLTSCWTLLECSRLFILSGFAFNPIGLSMAANIYTLQTASIFGVFGMSYWLLLVNLLGLKVWIESFSFSSITIWACCFGLPFIFGFLQLKKENVSSQDFFNTVLVQPVFPIEESLKFRDATSFIRFVTSEWTQLLTLTKEHMGKNIDLVVLPEFIVPFPTYSPVFRHEDVKKKFTQIFGEKAEALLPALQEPLAYLSHDVWMVSNGYWLQGLANVLNAPVIAGMEDVEDFSDGHREYYSAAQYAEPKSPHQFQLFKRYDKRILVPMGEYIPFSFCRNLAASYGIAGSFTPGKEAKIFPAKIPFGASICYEETFGHLMRENRLNGAQILVNLTSDAWYPTLAQQHCDHSRLRTVENGIPLVRSCNTGITCGFDCFGRELMTLGRTPEEKISKAGALYLQVPIFSYPTIYSHLGDYLIVALSFFGIFCFFILRKF